MLSFVRNFVALGVLCCPAVALAEDGLPDLKGRWLIETLGMQIGPPDTGPPKPVTVRNAFVIDWQDGIRFSGRELSQEMSGGMEIESDEERFAGVVGPDNATAFLVDENGFRDCWIRSPEQMDCVYRHVLDGRSIVGRNTWTKEPE